MQYYFLFLPTLVTQRNEGELKENPPSCSTTSSSPKLQSKGLPEVSPSVTGGFHKVLILFYLVLPICTSRQL